LPNAMGCFSHGFNLINSNPCCGKFPIGLSNRDITSLTFLIVRYGRVLVVGLCKLPHSCFLCTGWLAQELGLEITSRSHHFLLDIEPGSAECYITCLSQLTIGHEYCERHVKCAPIGSGNKTGEVRG
jgi:hypothetical protein